MNQRRLEDFLLPSIPVPQGHLARFREPTGRPWLSSTLLVPTLLYSTGLANKECPLAAWCRRVLSSTLGTFGQL